MARPISVNRSMASGVVGLLSLSILCVARPSDAAIINGGFETGNFNGWTTIGDTSIKAGFGSGPTEGNYEGLVTNRSDSVSAPNLEKFLGVEAGSLNTLGNGNTTNGSAIKQTFTAKSGDVLSFDWNFLKNTEPDPIFNDFAFVSLNSLSTLASPLTSKLVPFSAFDQQTEFKPFSFKIPTTGTYTLGLGVTNVTDTVGDSGLLVDNVKLEAVPEPSAVLGIIAVAVGAAASRLLRKQTAS